MNRFTFFLATVFSFVFLGCTYSKTTHQFSFYGSTQESHGRDFFYVAYGVTGAATATYHARGGGHMKEGLIADAKSNLIKSHPLGPNQSYTNMSIDIQTTESGGTNGQVASINKISMTATISADVIEFGNPPMDYALPVRNIGKIEILGSSGSSFGETGVDSLSGERLSFYYSLKRGDKVEIVVDGERQPALVLSKLSGEVKVQLTDYDAGKKLWVSIDDIIMPEKE